MNPEQMAQIAARLQQATNVVILPHLNADGDALGAALALGLALQQLGKKVDVLLDEAVPPTLNFLPGQNLVRKSAGSGYDLALNIDNGDVTRLGSRAELFLQSPFRMSIDHHATNKVDADMSYIDTTASATGEIVFDLIHLLKASIDHDIATCLYTAILTDTGGFRFANTTPRTHEITAHLMTYHIDHGFVAKKVFDTISHQKLQLMRMTLDSMRLLAGGKIAVAFVRYDEVLPLRVKSDDFEGLVNLGRNLIGVEVSLFMREERPGAWKGSLRSNGCVDVAIVAETVEGGGHKRASGFNVVGDLEAVISDLSAKIEQQMRECQDGWNH